MNVSIKNERLIQHFDEQLNSPYKRSEKLARITGKTDPVLDAEGRKWVVDHTESISFGYLETFLEVSEMYGFKIDLTLDTVKNIMPGLLALYMHQSKHGFEHERNLDIIIKTFAAVLSYIAINEHGFWYKAAPAAIIYSTSKAIKDDRKHVIFSITDGKKVLTNFLPFCREAAVPVLIVANGFSLMIDGVVEEYERITGTNLCEYGLANLFVN